MSIAPETPQAQFSERQALRDSRHSSKKKRKRDEETGESHQRKKHKRRQNESNEDGSERRHKHHRKKDALLKESQQSTQSQSTPAPKAAPSPFSLQTSSLYLPLSPISQASPTNGVCAEHLSPLILTYVPSLKGILLSYSNPRISNSPPPGATTIHTEDEVVLGRSIAEYAFSYVWLTAEFLVLKPTSGAEMEGYISVENESRLGVLCWNLFNASIERRRMPKDWRWDGPTSRKRTPPRRDVDADEGDNEQQDEEQEKEDEAEGGFLDGNNEPVMGRHIKFKILDWELDQSYKPADANATSSSLVSFEGTMLSDKDEEGIIRELKIKEADRLAAIRKAREKKVAARKQAAEDAAEEG